MAAFNSALLLPRAINQLRGRVERVTNKFSVRGKVFEGGLLSREFGSVERSQARRGIRPYPFSADTVSVNSVFALALRLVSDAQLKGVSIAGPNGFVACGPKVGKVQTLDIMHGRPLCVWK
jgi:hypothetical protein